MTSVVRLCRMAADIVPIRLGLTKGDLYTLWAPRWRDAGDEWEALLGKDEDLYAFDSIADLVAFVRTNSDNDLADHPAWEELTEASAHRFDPAEDRQYDLIGVQELVAEKPTEDSVATTAPDAGHCVVGRFGVRAVFGDQVLQRQPGARLAGHRHRQLQRQKRPQALDRDRGRDRPELGQRRRRDRPGGHHPRRRRGGVGEGGGRARRTQARGRGGRRGRGGHRDRGR